MSLKNIVVILLRLFSLYWLVSSISMFASVAATMMPYHSTHPNFWNYAAPVFLLILAVVVFLLALPIARFVTPPSNDKLSLGSLSLYELYCFSFTFLGLYFVLFSIANTFNWLHYFLLVSHCSNGSDPLQFASFYKLTGPLITLISGGLVLLFAPRCARKLSKIQHRYDQN